MVGVVLPKELVLLGLLAEEPSHAYGLEEKIQARQMTEWTEIAMSSIYRLLDRLAKRDLIAARLEQGGQGAARKVYSLNDAGREALAEGILHHLADLSPMKTPLHICLAYITEADRDGVLERLDNRLVGVGHASEHIAQMRAQILGAIEQAETDRKAEFTLRIRLLFSNVLHHIRAEKAFLAEARKLVDEAGAELFRDSGSQP